MILNTVLQEKCRIDYMLARYQETLSELPKGTITEKQVKGNIYYYLKYFVSDNRSGNYKGEEYDFIFGPVANDDVYTTFTLYTAGALTKEQTLEALKIKKLYNQLVLTYEKALSYLKFVRLVPRRNSNGKAKIRSHADSPCATGNSPDYRKLPV